MEAKYYEVKAHHHKISGNKTPEPLPRRKNSTPKVDAPRAGRPVKGSLLTQHTGLPPRAGLAAKRTIKKAK